MLPNCRRSLVGKALAFVWLVHYIHTVYCVVRHAGVVEMRGAWSAAARVCVILPPIEECHPALPGSSPACCASGAGID
ncbi:hypothetical protein B0I37DRAFT_382609 [Chaetomium sp. MPI-CAGE-AT-0009]|nr:hypothetical protein B0I37DRAFT_382609 [Chaetomium sp. MPI-CAGE-AT-0009]